MDWSLSHKPLISDPADHVRPASSQVVIVPGLISLVSFAVLLPPLGVFLERGCGADFFINILLVRCPLTPCFPTKLTLLYQTILGYMYAYTLILPSSLAHLSSLNKPRNHSRFVVHAKLTDCFRS